MEEVLVTIAGARNVLAADSGGTSDPYVIMTLLDSKDKPIVAGGEFKTAVIKNTLNPEWKEEFKIGAKYDLRLATKLSFVLKDSDGLFSKDDFLGKVEVPVEVFTQNKLQAGPLDNWFRIEMIPGRMKQDATGELHLIFRSAHAAVAGEEESDAAGSPGKLGQMLGGAAGKDVSGKPPNVLFVTLKSGNGLLAMDSNGKSDPFVNLKLNGQKHKSSVQKESLKPQWNSRFGFRLTDTRSSSKLSLMVYDEDTTYDDFMGRGDVALNDLTPHEPKKDIKVELGDKNGKKDKKSRGHLTVDLLWTFEDDLDAACKKKEKSMFDKFKSTVGITAPDHDYDSDEEGEMIDDGVEEKKKSPEEEEKEREEQAKKKEELMAELTNIEIKSGDYQVIVHIIEARDLVPKDATGTSDPVVHVHVLKEEFHTAAKKQVLNCVWDESLIFNLRDMDKSEIEMGYIKLCVMDSNTLQRAELIGEAQFDLSHIYSKSKHQLANVWIGLVDTSSSLNPGIQGYLRASITVVGPGDKFDPPPSPFDGNQADMEGNIIMPSTVSQKVKFLCARIHCAEELVPMDIAVVSKAGLDAYITASLAGGKRIRTRVRTKKGLRHELSPSFNEELMLVLREPSMADTVTFAVYDWDRVNDEVVAHFYHSIKLVRGLGDEMGPFWTNLYGAPLKGNKVDVGDTVKKQMNRMPEIASCYRGRVLMTLKIIENEDDQFEENDQKRSLRKLPRDLYPRTRIYKMRAHFVLGSGIPKFMSPKNPLNLSKMQLVMSLRLTELASTRERNNKQGMVKWNMMDESEPMLLPEDIDQIPDIFLYLCKGDGDGRRPICFRRFKARELIEQKGGFNSNYEWLLMKEDPSIDALKDDEFPGNVLVRLGLGTREEAEANPWPKEDVQEVNQYHPCQLRVHVYQGRSLPAADSNGLLDPYVVVRCMDVKEEQTAYLKKTKDPLWYETKHFDINLPRDRRFMPQVMLRVMDWDLDANDYVGMATLNLSEGHIRTSEQLRNGEHAKLPNPKWYPIFFQEPGDSEGEILASVEIIKKQQPMETIPVADSIEPIKKRAFLELTVLGLRDLEPYQFMPIQLPFVEFILGSKSHVADEMKTEKSKRPSGSNPNFLQRIVKPIDLPVDAFFTPRLNIIVKDTRLGGFQTPIVGSASVEMSPKVPWAVNYVPPQQDSFAEVDVMACDDDDETSSLLGGVIGGLESDNGAGVFGALKNMGVEFDPGNPDNFKDVDFESSETEESEEDHDDIKPYLRGRKIYENDLETELITTPFEKYTLHIGQKKKKKSLVEMMNPFSKKAQSKPSGEGSGIYKVAGFFKGLVRVMEREDEHPLFDMEKLMKAMPYEIRVYILDGLSFEPMDPTINGKQGKSDPYLKLRLGREKINDRKNYLDDTVDPDFYRSFVIPASLPGASILTVDSFDHDLIGGDDLIGSTSIDLEDRLFHPKWQEMGQPPVGSSAAPKKPLERRTMTIPTSKRSMGLINMWVDILSTSEAHSYPAIDVSLPPPVEMELRVVVWKAKDVPSFDIAEDMNDLFIRCWLEGSEYQETDIHWRAKKGKGSFNWRMRFPVKLGHKQPNSMYPYFHIQAWDKDILSANDAIGDHMTSLKPFFEQAYKSKAALQFYEDDEALRKKKKDTNDDAEAVRKIKEAAGLWDDTDPPDSKWFPLTRKNHQTNKSEAMGKVCVSIELVPKDKAKQHAVGMGRSAPNHTPYLPPPAGRLSFSLNPFKVLNDLLGDSICRRLTCCLCCVAVLVLVYFLAPFINLAIVTFK